MKKLKIGYFGFGKSTNRYHLPYVNIRENIEVKTICYPTRDLEKEKEYPEVLFTTSEIDLLTDPSIDLIIVVTPPKTHFELGKKALENGKHVLIEKPFCPSVDEAKILLDLAREKNLIAMSFQNRRFDSDFLTVKNVIEGGKLGEIVDIESHFDYYRPEPTAKPFTKYFEGSFYGLGVHMVDQFIALFGNPDAVSYDIRKLLSKEKSDDTFEVNMHYGDLKCKAKTSHLVKIQGPKFIVHGTKGSFVKDGIDRQEEFLKDNIMPGEVGFGLDKVENYGTLEYINDIGETVVEKVTSVEGDYGRIYDHMYESIINNQPKLISDEDIICNMSILQNGYVAESPHVIHLEKGSN